MFFPKEQMILIDKWAKAHDITPSSYCKLVLFEYFASKEKWVDAHKNGLFPDEKAAIEEMVRENYVPGVSEANTRTKL